MKWSKEAERAISKVPFFVKKRVRNRVEEEAKRSGSMEVRIEHVRACHRRFLEDMEDDVRGYQVESCFGQMGCPNSAVPSEGLAERIEEMISRRRMKEFLKERVKGPLKPHHEFRVSISNCPNACSRPQIVDIGLIGARRPRTSEKECTHCMNCVATCKEGALSLDNYMGAPVIDDERCLGCGQCIKACPTGTIEEEITGYRILLGGKLGRHPQLGREIPGIYLSGSIEEMVDHFLDLYQSNCSEGERLGEILNRMEWNFQSPDGKKFEGE